MLGLREPHPASANAAAKAAIIHPRMAASHRPGAIGPALAGGMQANIRVVKGLREPSMTVLATGGAGYIGSHMVPALVDGRRDEAWETGNLRLS
jgi:hypothetical protein